uniref:Ion_trans_2 domain-containing protein n=1 Tax=Heterorhabditis bacteriophora TaxID=37862 RepID=A0A1I7WZS0_HETBA
MVSFSLDENSNDKDINSYMGNEQNAQVVLSAQCLKPYYLWKQQFMEDRCCDEKQLIKEVISPFIFAFYLLISSIPHIILNFLLFFYIVLGAFLFRFLDEGIGKEGVRESILFAFTTITTIGGNLNFYLTINLFIFLIKFQFMSHLSFVLNYAIILLMSKCTIKQVTVVFSLEYLPVEGAAGVNVILLTCL